MRMGRLTNLKHPKYNREKHSQRNEYINLTLTSLHKTKPRHTFTINTNQCTLSFSVCIRLGKQYQWLRVNAPCALLALINTF